MDQLNKENVPGNQQLRKPLLPRSNTQINTARVAPVAKKNVQRKPLGIKNQAVIPKFQTKETGPVKKTAGLSKTAFEIFSDDAEPSKPTSIAASKTIPVPQTSKASFSVYRDVKNQEEDEDSASCNSAVSSYGTERQVDIRDAQSGTCSNPQTTQLGLSEVVNDTNYRYDRDIEELEVNSAIKMEEEKEISCSGGSEETSQDTSMICEIPKEISTLDLQASDKCLAEYSEEVHQYLRDMEVRIRPRANYMMRQPDITHSMRSILVDWLVEVSQEYKLEVETLYLTVSYIDRFLSSMSVLRSKLQLVGAASMFIASKYEEVYPPDLSEFVYITDDTYSKKQVLKMEHVILKALAFDLSAPTIYYFLQRILCLCNIPDNIKNLAKYLSELTLLEGEVFLRFLPSEIAASALALANFTFGCVPWTDDMWEVSGYKLKHLDDCIVALHIMFLNANECKHKAIREKYKSPLLNAVSLMTPRPLNYSRCQ